MSLLVPHIYVLCLQVVHWQSPHMHAYYPALTSWPSLLGDMLADAINCLGFTWVSNDGSSSNQWQLAESDILGQTCFVLTSEVGSELNVNNGYILWA